MRRNARNQRDRQVRGNRQRNHNNRGDNRNFVICRSPNYMPDHFRTHLSYNLTSTLTNSTQMFALAGFSCNTLPQVVSGGSNEPVLGWTELSAIYYTYKVIKAKCIINVGNKEAFPLTIAIGTYPQPTPTATATIVNEVLSQNTTSRKVLGPLTGASTGTIRKRWDLATVAGSADTLANDGYSSLTASGGPDYPWTFLFCLSSTTALTTGGVHYSAQFNYEVDFTGLYPQD